MINVKCIKLISSQLWITNEITLKYNYPNKMKKKHIFYLVALLLTAIISSPFIFLSKTYLQEDNVNRTIPQGFTNDASQLSLTKIDSIFDVPNSETESINQLKYVFEYAKNKNIPISIAGAKHSMGGHTMYLNGVVLNMRTYNKMSLDTVSNILTIGSGALWEEAIEYLNGYGKSISVMQAFSSFSIGGSISVNGHGWQKNAPPVSSSQRFIIYINESRWRNSNV